jgi:hypothetical protein
VITGGTVVPVYLPIKGALVLAPVIHDQVIII